MNEQWVFFQNENGRVYRYYFHLGEGSSEDVMKYVLFLKCSVESEK